MFTALASQRRLAASGSDLPPGTSPGGSRGQILSEALRLFAEAEAAGEPMQVHAAERGLAYADE